LGEQTNRHFIWPTDVNTQSDTQLTLI